MHSITRSRNRESEVRDLFVALTINVLNNSFLVAREAQPISTNLFCINNDDDDDDDDDNNNNNNNNWETHHCHHRTLQGNHIFVPTPVDSSSTGECGLFSKHHDDRMSSRYSSFLIFKPAALCLWAQKLQNNTTVAILLTSRLGCNGGERGEPTPL